MKEIQFTQTYELTVTVNMEVEDDWTEQDVQDQLADFPITVDVEDLYEQMYEHLHHHDILMGEEGDDLPRVVGLCVDSLVTTGYPDHIVMNAVTETD